MKKTKTADAASAKTTAAGQYDWSQSQATGFENVQREDLGIPFLTIIESKSPEVDKTHKDYAAKKIIGAEAGDIINTLSRDIYHKFQGDPVIVVPCSFEKSYVEWKPRDSGGGLVRVHKDPIILNETTRDASNHDVLKNGNLIVTTHYFFCLVLRDSGRVPVVLGLTSTRLKASRFWLNLSQGIKLLKGDGTKFTPPLFSHSYKLSTVPEANNEGSWFTWKIEVNEILKDPILISDALETAKKALQGQRALAAPKTGDDVPYA